MMNITNFRISDMKLLEDTILTRMHHRDSYINESTLRELLKVSNIGFTLENISRLQSTLLCELGDSYVQQSQRYVGNNVSELNYVIPYISDTDTYNWYKDLVRKSYLLYDRMTELNNPSKKGRLKEVDFKNGIPYEDGRYILPLAVRTNLSVSMSMDKMIDMFRLFNKYREIFSKFMDDLIKIIPYKNVLSKILGISYLDTKDDDILHDYYKKYLSHLNSSDVKEIELDNDVEKNIAIGALTSTSYCSPVEKYKMWEDKECKCKELIERVMGYGHYSISEQSRNIFAMKCSLSAYHQLIRHRHQNIHRDNLNSIIKSIIDEDIEDIVYTPKSIRNSWLYKDYMNLIKEYISFIKQNTHIGVQNISNLLLNCFKIKIVVSNNIRHDNWIFSERLCKTAQEEIRELMDKKYNILKSNSALLAKYGLPSCVYGACKEGGMSCNSQKEMRDKYKIIL